MESPSAAAWYELDSTVFLVFETLRFPLLGAVFLGLVFLCVKNVDLHQLRRTCPSLLVPSLVIGLLVHTMTADYSLVIKVILVVGAVVCLVPARGKAEESMYGLQHGKLHVDVSVPMWMNMGYWKVSAPPSDSRSTLTTDQTQDPAASPKTLAEACRDLLKLVLCEAGISNADGRGHLRCLIDVGFGCGEQTVYMMSEKPLRPSDKLWWDDEHGDALFGSYVGITKDESQCRYAQDRVSEMKRCNIDLFCADASRPQTWDEQILARLVEGMGPEPYEMWLLALDTAYHFSPSRWGVIRHAHHNFNASFMAFDLCVSPTASLLEKVQLRVLTTLMGAPWANFDTPAAYRQRLRDIGYQDAEIQTIDVSEHVFTPLAKHLEDQHRRLRMLGMGLGSFQAARWLFKWWGNSGVVRGVVVVAKHPNCNSKRQGRGSSG